MDKSQYQQIQVLIEKNPIISGFDLYYLGFFSHFVPQLTLHDIFTHIGNIIHLHNDQLINNSEKIEFLIRMLSKKIDAKHIESLFPQNNDQVTQTTNFLHEYFRQIVKILQKYTNVSKFELFYLGRFHAICPSYKIAELFQHINNINALVTQDLIDEETQVDFLLRILNKKIEGSNPGNTILNIPQEMVSPFNVQENTMLELQPPSPCPELDQRSKSYEEVRQVSEKSNNLLSVLLLENSRNCRSEASKSDGRDEGELVTKIEEIERIEYDPTDENEKKMSVEIEDENENGKHDENDISMNEQEENKNERSSLDELETKINERMNPKTTEERKLNKYDRADREFSEVESFQDDDEENSSANESEKMSVEDQNQDEEHSNEDPEGSIEELSVREREEISPSNKVSEILETKKKPLSMSDEDSSQEKDKTDVEHQNYEKSIEEVNNKSRSETSAEKNIEDPDREIMNQNSEPVGREDLNEQEEPRQSLDEADEKETVVNLEEEVVITSFKVPERIIRNVKIEPDKGVEASHQSESDNQSEVKRLMSQLYPDKDKKKAKGTFDDILDNIFNSEESKPGSIQKFPQMASSESPRDTQNSGQIHKRTLSEQEEQPSLSDDPYRVRIHKPIEGETESQQPNKSFILDWRSTNQGIDQSLEARNDSKESILLQQVVKHIKPSLLEDNIIIKPEENEVRGLLEAVTQVDPQEDDSSGKNVSPFQLSPSNQGQSDHDWLNNQVDTIIRACPTVKQSLADLPDGNIEDHEYAEIAHSDLNRSDELKEKERLSNTQLSNLPGIVHTLEEEEISRQLLVMIQKERQDREDYTLGSVATQNKGIELKDNYMEVEKENKAISGMEEEEADKKSKRDVQHNPTSEEEKHSESNLPNCGLCRTCSLKPLVGFDNCEHRFHEDCLRERINKKIDEKRFPLKCPIENCTNELSLADLVDLLEKDKQEKFVIGTLKLYIDITKDVCCCPTPGCSFAFLKSYRPNRFRCTLCKKTYCMNCRVGWHQGLSCKEFKQTHKYEEGEEVNYFLTRFKQCSECNRWVSKKTGVDIMRCRCGVCFCYNCGKSVEGEQCDCENHNDQKSPKVQPELFHKAMQAPDEFKSFADNKAEVLKKASPAEKDNSRGISGSSGYIYKPAPFHYETSESRAEQKNKLISMLTGSDHNKEKK